MSCTLDEGRYYMFDSRTKITEAAFYIDARQDDLFCHERYNDFNVLLGFGDGLFKHIDMRKASHVSVNNKHRHTARSVASLCFLSCIFSSSFPLFCFSVFSFVV